MNLIDLETMQPISDAEFRAKHPFTSFPAELRPDVLVGFGAAELIYTSQPYSEFASYVYGIPQENDDGSYTTTWAETKYPLEQCQSIVLDKLARHRAEIAYKNVVYNGTYIPVNSDVLTLLQVVISGDEPIDFKGVNGWLRMSPADAKMVLARIQAQVQAAFSNEKKHHNAITALQTADEVIAYDFSQGW